MAVFLLCLSGLSSAVAATFTVSNTNDSGLGSLRQAIADANSNGEADTINFSTSGTITLTGGEIDITEALTINGNNAIISGNNASQIFDVRANLNLSDLTLTKGHTDSYNNNGGAIYAQSPSDTPIDINITRCTLSDNHVLGDSSGGGAIAVSKVNLTINNSQLLKNTAEYGGGAIGATGDNRVITINNSTLSNNTAGYFGGAIHAGSGIHLNINHSVLSWNKAKRDGGAIYLNIQTKAVINHSVLSDNTAKYAGAIQVDRRSEIFINNSTLSQNTANSGGAIFSISGGNISNSTFWKNKAKEGRGGAIFSQNKLTIRNSTLVGNITSSPSGGGAIGMNYTDKTLTLHSNVLLDNTNYFNIPENCSFLGDTKIDPSSANNLMDNGCGLSNGSNGNIVNTGLSVGSVLEDLADNGCATPAGDETSASCVKTMKLTENSPALDKGSNIGNLTTDQRGNGYPRTSNGQTDIGAYEASVATYTIGGEVSGLDETANGEGNDKLIFNLRLLAHYDTLPIASWLLIKKNGPFQFDMALESGDKFLVHPEVNPQIADDYYQHQTCTAHPIGEMVVGSANITNIQVVCTYNKYKIGGNVSGLNGTVELHVESESGSHSKTVSGNGTVNFAFDPVRNGDYTVTVKTHPAGQYCQVTNGDTGKLRGRNINSVKVTCSSYKVGRIFADSFEK